MRTPAIIASPIATNKSAIIKGSICRSPPETVAAIVAGVSAPSTSPEGEASGVGDFLGVGVLVGVSFLVGVDEGGLVGVLVDCGAWVGVFVGVLVGDGAGSEQLLSDPFVGVVHVTHDPLPFEVLPIDTSSSVDP